MGGYDPARECWWAQGMVGHVERGKTHRRPVGENGDVRLSFMGMTGYSLKEGCEMEKGAKRLPFSTGLTNLRIQFAGFVPFRHFGQRKRLNR